MISICLGKLGEKSIDRLLEGEETKKHMICRAHPGTVMLVAHNESVHEMWFRDSLDHESCDANDLFSSIRKLMLAYSEYAICLLSVCTVSMLVCCMFRL